ncbi:MAG: AB hydrolase superfamily protein YvaM [Alphaproteobacteria bacterium MarineAlpha2_Bin1]|nr:MAG: AB hydrolase superfamily protein YvaM [Alphaproteobacteria bacterium MarineAlpha2_Bin1]|tara:strand:+ start:17 stop:808 length:792 start_codon:yes stop_codon:yes gene_type:complete
MKYYEANLSNNSLKYFKIGKGRPLIYIPSFEGFLLTESIKELSKSYEIFIPIIPGFSNTSKISEFESIEDLSKLFIEFIEQIKADKVDLIGYSLGGYLGSWITVKRPDIIDQLILISPLGFDLNDKKIELKQHNFENLVYKYPDRFSDLNNNENIVNQDHLDLYSYEKLDEELLEKLSSLKNLTLILLGNDDMIVPSISGQIIKEKIEHSYFIYVYDSGHGIEIDQPKRVTTLLSDFLMRGQAFIVNWSGRDETEAPTREMAN